MGLLINKPPFDSNIDFVTWNWLNQLQQWISGDVFPNIVQTASFTIGLNFLYPCDATSGAITVTLPAASSQLAKRYVIKKIDSSANTVTIAAAGSDTIDGAATKILSSQNSTLYIESDGISKWYIVAGSAVGGSGTTSPLTTKGDVWTYSTTDTRQPIGIDGTIATADSTQTTGWKWSAANTLTAGCLILLNSYIASASASINITSQITSSYDAYFFEFISIVPSANNNTFNINFSTDNGVTWLATNYKYAFPFNQTGNVSNLNANNAATTIALAPNLSTTGFALNGYGLFFDPLNTSFGKSIYFNVQHQNSSDTFLYERHGVGGNTTTSAINAIQFIMSAGTITSGIIRIYGIAKSSNQMLMNPGIALVAPGVGNVNVPNGVSAAEIVIQGGGGAGGGTAVADGSAAGGGGGSGEWMRLIVPVTGGGTIGYVVGASNPGTSGASGNNGNASQVTVGAVTYTAAGGKGGIHNGAGGAGGGRLGGAGGAAGAPGGAGTSGTSDGIGTLGGSGGGGAGTAGGTNAGGAGAAEGTYTGLAGGGSGVGHPGGGSGGSSQYGQGGQGAAGGTNNGGNATSTSYGAGGGGAAGVSTNQTGGTGAQGAIFIKWL